MLQKCQLLWPYTLERKKSNRTQCVWWHCVIYHEYTHHGYMHHRRSSASSSSPSSALPPPSPARCAPPPEHLLWLVVIPSQSGFTLVSSLLIVLKVIVFMMVMITLSNIFWNFVENKVWDDETLARPPGGGGDHCWKSFLQWVQDCNGRWPFPVMHNFTPPSTKPHPPHPQSPILGKWHLGVGTSNEFLPTRQGFASYLGIPYR